MVSTGSNLGITLGVKNTGNAGTDGNPDDGARSTVTEQGSRIGAMAPILASGSAGWRHCSFRCTVPLYNSTKLLVPNGYDGPPKESVWVVPLHKCLESGGADPVDLVLYCGWGGTVIVLLMVSESLLTGNGLLNAFLTVGGSSPAADRVVGTVFVAACKGLNINPGV